MVLVTGRLARAVPGARSVPALAPCPGPPTDPGVQGKGERGMSFIHRVALASAASVATIAAAALAVAPAAGAQVRSTASPHGHQSFISRFHKISTIASTVPGNGDVNPY